MKLQYENINYINNVFNFFEKYIEVNAIKLNQNSNLKN